MVRRILINPDVADDVACNGGIGVTIYQHWLTNSAYSNEWWYCLKWIVFVVKPLVQAAPNSST